MLQRIGRCSISISCKVIKLSCFAVVVFTGLLHTLSVQAARYTPMDLCAITSNASYESITLPLSLSSEYPSGSVQTIAVTVGDSEQPGVPSAFDDVEEFVVIFIDTDNDGTPDALTNASCLYSTTATPPGCTVTQDVTLPTVTEDTTFRGRVMLSYGATTPANGCGDNGHGDSEDFLVLVDVQESITLTDVTAPEDDGPITVSATLSHDVRDASGLVSFSVDYQTSDGTATVTDNDYEAASGTLTFNGQAGNTQTFQVNPTADIVPEGDQTILVSMQNLSNTTHGIDISDTCTLVLAEDDTAVDLSINLSVDNSTPEIGSTVVFTLQVSNAGPDDAVGAQVQDMVPQGFSSVTALSAPSGSNLAISGNTVNWTGIDVPTGESVSATFSAVVEQP